MRTDAYEHELPAAVETFLETVTAWPSARWHELVATARSRTSAQHTTAVALCDAILAHDRKRLAVWFTEDAALTAASEIGIHLRPADHQLATTMLVQASLAILARPALPTLDYAILMAPFLPLSLP